MPAADTVLLPLSVGLALLGIIFTGIAWRRADKGRVVQGVGLTLAPIALYLTGLLQIVWRAVVDVVAWAGRLIFSPMVWIGLILLAVCVVLWVVGGVLARRTVSRPRVDRGQSKAVSRPDKTSASGRRGSAPQQAAPVDDDMAEIEAILKSRGIE